MVNSKYYYDEHWKNRGGKLKDDPILLGKVKKILRMIPGDVFNIVDIGCGDGAITNILVENYDVSAVDSSSEALSYLSNKIKSIIADATMLPFPSNSFDLVFSSEMLEHIEGDKKLRDTINEIKRVSSKYILLSVPNDEKLKKRNTYCGTCNKIFHIYLHFHSFDSDKLKSLFKGWELLETDTCGVPEKPSINWITILKNRLGRTYFYVDGLKQSCPFCGSIIITPKKNFISRIFSFSINNLERVLLILLRKKAKPDWLLVLFRRPS